jgi:hypothetical protein
VRIRSIFETFKKKRGGGFALTYEPWYEYISTDYDSYSNIIQTLFFPRDFDPNNLSY